MDASTAAAWAGWVAAVVAIASALIAVRANRHTKAYIEEARRAANAAESSATDASRSADAAERQAAAAEAMIPPPPPKVAWRVSRVSPGTLLLANVGTDVAYGVRVSVPGFDPTLVRVEAGAVVRPAGQIPVQVTEFDHTPVLVEFHVMWDGQAEPVAVPIHGW